MAFVPKITTLHANNIYLDGYFQTEKYFKDFKKEIREDFTPKVISTTASDWTQKIKNGGNTISVHVRRGDYVGHKILGEICTIEYYQKAIEEISKLTEDPHFFIFSDDTMWVKENINLPNKIDYVSSPNLKDYEELVLMSICHHNIIANSSFSWWSAWLNLNPNKIVIAPAKWAHGKFNKKKLSNIAPQTWIRI
ncbi:MAG: alpha-1,2-fucosyltransferase [Candidatus Vogelbacteria bacterium]|nr:alpha-1,2-fucosyltransferase [Candidatus Vogelbacteria bacterium]